MTDLRFRYECGRFGKEDLPVSIKSPRPTLMTTASFGKHPEYNINDQRIQAIATSIAV